MPQVLFCKFGTREGSAFEDPRCISSILWLAMKVKDVLKVQMQVLRDVSDKPKLNSSTASLAGGKSELARKYVPYVDGNFF